MLIAGGVDNFGNVLSSAELFDPATGTFTLTAGNLNTARLSHTATLLPNGMVLIAGGAGQSYGVSALSSAELYDPNAGTFSNTGSMLTTRSLFTATLLNNGKVLVAGGWDANGNALASAELYDPSAGSFAATGRLSTARGSHAAALLNNGSTLLAGGWDVNGNTLTSTEIYDPVVGAFSPTGVLNTARAEPTSTLLPSGMVLVAGGLDNESNPLASAELYQPATLTPPGLVSIALTPLNPSITAGVSQRFVATGTFGDNSTQTLASATWSSSANPVAAVTNDASNYGAAFGVGQGSATASACTGTVCGSTTVTVSPQAPLPPDIQGLAPGSGTVGSWVAISGANFGVAQGSSSVTFGGTAASVVSWSDTAIFVVVPNGLTLGQTVPVVVTATSGASNSAAFLPISTSAPYRVLPQEVNLLVGQTRTVSVTDSSGNAVTGLEWTASNSSVVSLSTDDPPVITAVAPGTVTLYVVGVPILVTVYPAGSSLPSGTPIWSAPIASLGSMVPAVPSSSGVDLFALDVQGNPLDNAGALDALRSDGSIAWSVPLTSLGLFSQVIPDFSGSALVLTPDTSYVGQGPSLVQRVDPDTHQLTNLYTSSSGHLLGFGSVIPHPSGVIFIQDNPIVVLNATSGEVLASIPLENSTCVNTVCIDDNGLPWTGTVGPVSGGGMIVAGDGNAYVPYSYITETGNGAGEAQTDTYLTVLRVGADGSFDKVQLGHWTGQFDSTVNPDGTQTVTCKGAVVWANSPMAITNAASGVAVFAGLAYHSPPGFGLPTGAACGSGGGTADPIPPSVEQISYVSQTGLGSQVNITPNVLATDDPNFASATNIFVPALQREDGSYIGADWVGNLYAIAPNGNVLWQQPINTGSGYLRPLTPLYATADGGAIVTTTTPCLAGAYCAPTLGILYTIDQNGNVTSQAPDAGAVISWTGMWNSASGNGISDLSPEPFVIDPDSFASQTGGNPSQSGPALPECPCDLQSTSSDSTGQVMEQQSTVKSQFALQQRALPNVSPVCPICDLQPPPTGYTPACTATPGTQSTFLLLVGDPGKGDHNSGNLFNLAAQTEADQLKSQGHRVVACRVSSIQMVDQAFITNGYIDGGVIYFGHSGPFTLKDAITGKKLGVASILAVGQESGPATNVSFANLTQQLSNIQTAHGGMNIMGPNAAFTVNGCKAGVDVDDYYWLAPTSIAKGLSLVTQRGVYAYQVGMYFSQLDAAHDNHVTGEGLAHFPSTPPIYMVPVGAPGRKRAASLFVLGALKAN